MSRNLWIVPIFVATVALASPDTSGAQSWVDEDWPYRIPITAIADSIAGNETLVDFPLHVSLQGPVFASVFANANPDGSDLLVTAGNGTTVLPREVVGFDAVAQTGEIWLRASSFSKSDREFFLYFGNPGATLPARPIDAWSEDYRAVYHFAENPASGLLRDSSPQGADVALLPIRNWTSSDVKEGPLHQAWNFNGTTHHLATTAITSADSNFVISAWLEHTGPGIDVFMQCNPGFWEINSQTNSDFNQPGYAGSDASVRWMPSPLPFDGEFHHFAWVFDAESNTVAFYFDGVPQTITDTFPLEPAVLYGAQFINPAGNQPVGIMSPMFFNNVDLFDGGGDEFRIREGVVSPEWILTEYRNQADPVGFFEFGEIQNNTVTSVDDDRSLFLSAASPNPFIDATSVRFRLARRDHVQLTVYDVAGRVVKRLVEGSLEPGAYEYQWGGRVDDRQRAAAGVYFLRLVTSEGTLTSKVSYVR